MGVAVAGAVAVVAVAGSASAETRTQYVGNNCWSISPNLVDIPHNGSVTVSTDTARPGWFTLSGDSKSVFGYTTDLHVEWRNLDNGRTGSADVTYRNSLADSNGFWIRDLDSGPGRVQITTSGVTRGLLTIPVPACTGEVVI
ncbi:hypothetical protein ABZV91_15960 [Nocardia sp. NPDC004568]|uniref:hypothetical protein n=1 Tax=Nocardia sp. NPDC004568 TaxID=3154551 RepID=UPI0033A4E9E7